MSFRYVKYAVIDDHDNVVGNYDSLASAQEAAEDFTESEDIETAVVEIVGFYEPIRERVVAVWNPV